MSWLNYLAYGSNLHPGRLGERVTSAELIGTLPVVGYRLVFHKKGQDASGKCNLIHTGHEQDIMHAALFRMQVQDKPILDRIEGKGRGYLEAKFVISHEGESYSCFTYEAQAGYIDEAISPFHWYKQLVLLGGEYHRFPEVYLNAIRHQKSIEDPNSERRKAHAELIKRLGDFNCVKTPQG